LSSSQISGRGEGCLGRARAPARSLQDVVDAVPVTVVFGRGAGNYPKR